MEEGDIEVAKMIVSKYSETFYMFSNVGSTMSHAMKLYFNQSVVWSIGRTMPTDNKLVSLSIDEIYTVYAGIVLTNTTEVVILNSTSGESL